MTSTVYPKRVRLVGHLLILVFFVDFIEFNAQIIMSSANAVLHVFFLILRAFYFFFLLYCTFLNPNSMVNRGGEPDTLVFFLVLAENSLTIRYDVNCCSIVDALAEV